MARMQIPGHPFGELPNTNYEILANNQLDVLFHIFICFVSLHVPTIRRSNCVNTSSGMILLLLLLLLIKRYNLYKVLACSTAFFQLSLFCAIFFRLCTFILLISSKSLFPNML